MDKPTPRRGIPDPELLDLYRRRRNRLAEELGPAALVLFGAGFREAERFVQDPDFYYLTGIEIPAAVLLLWPRAPREDRREILFLPRADPKKAIWVGSYPEPVPDTAARVGIPSVFEREALDEIAGSAITRAEILGYIQRAVPVGTPPTETARFLHRVRETFPGVRFQNFAPVLDRFRRVKDEEEIRRLKRAIHITAEALAETVREIRPGMREYEIQARIEYGFRRRGAMGPAFPSIVASGPRAAILHYADNEAEIRDGDLVLLDVGARFGYYCADITRTVPASGVFTPEQKDLYVLVLRAQERAIAAVRPGARLRGEVLQAARAVLEERGLQDHFLHGIGHYVGLEVHDAGDPEAPLEPGCVVTVEPGIYLPEKGLGIRIEDMVRVTSSGPEVLTRSLPREPEAVEAWMVQAGGR